MTFSRSAFFLELSSKFTEEDKRLHMTWSFWLTLSALLFLACDLGVYYRFSDWFRQGVLG